MNLIQPIIYNHFINNSKIKNLLKEIILFNKFKLNGIAVKERFLIIIQKKILNHLQINYYKIINASKISAKKT